MQTPRATATLIALGLLITAVGIALIATGSLIIGIVVTWAGAAIAWTGRILRNRAAKHQAPPSADTAS